MTDDPPASSRRSTSASDASASDVADEVWITRSEQVNIQALDWEHSYDRTPYDNLKALLPELPDDTPDVVIVGIAFRYIAGYGPKSTPRVLARIRREEGSE